MTSYRLVPTLHGLHEIPEDEPDHTACPFCMCRPEMVPGQLVWRHRPDSDPERVAEN